MQQSDAPRKYPGSSKVSLGLARVSWLGQPWSLCVWTGTPSQATDQNTTLLVPNSSFGQLEGSFKEKACQTSGTALRRADPVSIPTGCPEEPCRSSRGLLPRLQHRDGGKPFCQHTVPLSSLPAWFQGCPWESWAGIDYTAYSFPSPAAMRSIIRLR